MRTHRHAARLAGLIAAACVLVAGALATAPTAGAAPPAPDAGNVATALQAQLGDRTAGSYLEAGKLVVTVTDASAAKAVRDAGAVPRSVARSGAQLQQVMTALNQRTKVTGSAWAVEPRSNQVLVSADSSVSAAEMARLQKVTKKFGAAVRYERVAGTFQKYISGGDAIYTGGSRCSLGFNVRNSAGTQFFVTAGHCTNIGANWTGAGGVTLGTRSGTSFPTNDYGIVRYTGSVSRPGNVNLYNGSFQDITSAANATVGQAARRSGSTTRVRSGSVTALNQTVRYPQGTVYQMIRTNICAQPGDSGGSLFAGSTALGLTSGGSGNCSTGGTTFFQPVTEPLSVYGVSVY